MRVVVIGHLEAVLGFSLVGVQGYIAEDAESMNQAVDLVLGDGRTGIVLVTDDAAELIRERIDQLKSRYDPPIFIEVPDPNGMNPERMTLTEVANQAIGIHK
jgi:vacuolar-type H+-ATPase subunit F/Vma7